jgi:hypothetical protein
LSSCPAAEWGVSVIKEFSIAEFSVKIIMNSIGNSLLFLLVLMMLL